MSNIPPRVTELVETFDSHIETYHSQQYNETQLRREFIDPFFIELGWDVTNKAGYAQAYKDVIHEDAIKIGGATKAPDYCFRIGGVRKFFLEAKKPSVNIKGDPHPAYQLRRYAWSAKLPLSILTDFEEFAVYDCQIRPKQTDKADAARIMFFTYKDYHKKWGEISDIFSKEAILRGSFDKFAVATKGKRGTTTVDTEFLKEIEKWRKMLARTITLRNRNLSKYEINFSVQRTIDRILFLRMCEDRGIETYQLLLGLVNGSNIYQRLCQIFEQADAKYNSGLFHFQHEKGRIEAPDELTLNLKVDDIPIGWILRSLYYPDCPYEFSVLPAEILGNVYEQFLGKVIRITPGHQAKIEEKPEVKKAGGVYYTPSYIVDYIVKNTVGKLIDGKTPRQITNIKILDPACGSGSFLLGAYTYLLNYHRDWYVDNNPQKYTKKIYQCKGGQWYLTNAEKKRILLNNIFGVDIDSQAVEVTKLSLLLKVLEGEDAQTLENQYRLFHERALPDLATNIKCGNSLISSDFFDNLDPESITEELRQRINPFDWHTEFPQIFSGKNPGFDTVIGNPPYVSFGLRDVGKMSKTESAYYRSRFTDSAEYKVSMYAMFMQMGIDKLKQGGNFSFIVPDSFLLGRYFSKLRQYILSSCRIEQLLMIRDRVFTIGTVGTSVIFTFQKNRTQSKNNHLLESALCENTSPFSPVTWRRHRYPQSYFETLEHNRFRLFFNRGEEALVRQVDSVSAHQLSTFIKLSSGLIGKHGKESIIASELLGDLWKPGILSGEEIRRFELNYGGGYILFDIKKLKSGFKDAHYDEPKLLCRQTGDRLIWTYDDRGYLCLNNLHVGNVISPKTNIFYLLAVLNSALMNCYYRLISLEAGRALAQTDIETLDKLPIRTIDFDNPDYKAKHNKMVQLVDRMLDLHKKLTAAKIPVDKTRIQRQIDTTDKQIDRLVYELYGLTEEEIAIVEGGE